VDAKSSFLQHAIDFSVEDEESEAASKGKGKQQPAPKQSRVAASARPDSS
jgi:hypothetical protein